MSAWLVENACEIGIPPSQVSDLEVCANEAVTNICSYGYADNPSDHSIHLVLETTGNNAALTLIDDGRPFNPLDVSLGAMPGTLEDAPIGGLGIRLIRALSGECRYSRVGHQNYLEIRIPLPPPDQPLNAASARGVDRRIDPGNAPPGTSERRQNVDRRQLGGVFRAAFFQGIPWHAVEEAIKQCPVRRLAPGEVLLESGQVNDNIYVLITGRLLVWLADADGAGSITIEPGASIGELSIIDGKPASARVTAEIQSDVAVISAEAFWSLLMPVSGFARNVMRELSERMRTSNEIIVARLRESVALEQLHKELSVAHDIQSSMLPARGEVKLDRREVVVHGLMDPARDIGGDFYDAFMPDDEHLFLVVGDVSGKGIPAALFMARAMAVLRAEATRNRRRPSTMLERANALLCANNEAGMFVTLLVALLNLETGELHYSNAGHLPACLRKGGGAADWMPLPRGLLAGMVEGVRYTTETVKLAKGDSVVLYTDGITEAMNPAGKFFGDARLLETLGNAPNRGIANEISFLRGAVADFVKDADPSDDITILGLRWFGPVDNDPQT